MPYNGIITIERKSLEFGGRNDEKIILVIKLNKKRGKKTIAPARNKNMPVLEELSRTGWTDGVG